MTVKAIFDQETFHQAKTITRAARMILQKQKFIFSSSCYGEILDYRILNRNVKNKFRSIVILMRLAPYKQLSEAPEILS